MIQKNPSIERLGQKFHGTGPHGPQAHLFVAVR